MRSSRAFPTSCCNKPEGENRKSGRVLEKSRVHRADTVRRFVLEGTAPHGEVCYCIEKNE